MTLTPQKIEEWKSKKYLDLEGFCSATLDSRHTALYFARESQKENGEELVLLEIEVENKDGKFFISLDRPEYTAYPDEQEILLQSGLNAKLIHAINGSVLDSTF